MTFQICKCLFDDILATLNFEIVVNLPLTTVIFASKFGTLIRKKTFIHMQYKTVFYPFLRLIAWPATKVLIIIFGHWEYLLFVVTDRQTDGETDRRADWTIQKAAWSQPRNASCICLPFPPGCIMAMLTWKKSDWCKGNHLICGEVYHCVCERRPIALQMANVKCRNMEFLKKWIGK